jgi:hypothetical protein
MTLEEREKKVEQREIRTNANRRKKGIRTLNTCRSRPTWRCRCEIGKVNKNVISKCEGSDKWSGEDYTNGDKQIQNNGQAYKDIIM